MLRIAIAEDEQQTAELLGGYIDRFCEETGLRAKRTVFRDGAALCGDYRPVWDIILMDISMPLMDGMRAARKIRETDDAVIIIFITSLARYAVKGYEVDAMDFVLKPVSYAQFAIKLRKAAAICALRVDRYVLLPGETETVRIPANDVLYIEVFDHCLYYHTAQGNFRQPGALKNIEEEWKALPFVRCSSGYLVNLHNVTGFTGDSVRVGDTVLPLSRGRKKEFLQRLSDYLGGGMR